MNNQIVNINNILFKSKYKILNYKSELIQLYNLIFKYCDENQVLISNININLSHINNNNYKLYDLDNDFNFNIYSINPYKDALNISNIIYKKYSKYVVMTSYLRNKEIIITIDNNRLIKIQLLFLYKKDNEADNLLNTIEYNKIKLKSIYNEIDNSNKSYIFNINYTSNLLELCILTHKLYHPTIFLKYNNGDEYIHNCFDTIVKSLGIGTKKEYKNVKNNFIKNLRKEVFNKLCNDDIMQIILLDMIAYKYIINNYDYNSIDDNDFDEIPHIIVQSKYLELIKKIINNAINNEYYINIKFDTLYLINDFRFKRTNIQIINKDNTKNTLLYIYNNLDYEVIPTISNVTNQIYIPHIFVIIRFLIINHYYNKLFNKYYNNEYTKHTIYIISQLYENLIQYYNNKNGDKLVEYLGIYIDDRIEKFKLGAVIYRPWQYEKKYNNLLTQ
jgi:hypothetical protein